MATQWVDFKALKQTVSIERILDHYGTLGQLKRKGKNLVGPCPIHKGTNPTQFHVSLDKNNFMCFGDCDGGGNILDLVSKVEGCTVRGAALKIQEWFGIETDKSKEQSPTAPPEPAKEKEEEKINKPLMFVLKNLDPEHPYLSERGLSTDTIAEFGLGYASKGLMKGRIAIPIHNENGELVAYAGRWPGDDPPEGEGKYKLPPNFHKSLVVFNLSHASEFAQEQGLIVAEGFFDCLKVWQAGAQNVVALMGSSLSPEQEELIVKTVGPQGKVALMFDEDEAGRACRDDALTRLAPRVYVKVIGLGKEGQPDSLSEEEIRNKVGL